MWALCDACYKFLNYDNFQQVNSGQNATLRFGIYEKKYENKRHGYWKKWIINLEGRR